MYICEFFITMRATSLKRVILDIGFIKFGQIDVAEKMFDENPKREVI